MGPLALGLPIARLGGSGLRVLSVAGLHAALRGHPLPDLSTDREKVGQVGRRLDGPGAARAWLEPPPDQLVGLSFQPVSLASYQFVTFDLGLRVWLFRFLAGVGSFVPWEVWSGIWSILGDVIVAMLYIVLVQQIRNLTRLGTFCVLSTEPFMDRSFAVPCLVQF